MINNSLIDYNNAQITAEIYNLDGSLVYTETQSVNAARSTATDSFNLFTGGANLKNNSSLSDVYFIRLKLVDSDGNLVGNVYTGSRSLEDWTEIVNQELEALEAAQ